MPKQVLLADDEETLTWSLSKTLARDRAIYEVTTSDNGLTALDILKKSFFDLVVLELGLPGINGLDLLARIKQEMPTTKVIIITGNGEREIEEKAKARGASCCVEKPFDDEQMRTIILKTLNEDVDKGFDGSMHGLKLPDLIQMNCLGQVTTALHVKKDAREGIIFFEDGKITHAQVGAIEGEEAFFSILSWQSGNFKFAGSQKAPKTSISSNWEYLLIEGMRKADEMALALAKGDLVDDIAAPVDEPCRSLIRDMSNLSELSGLVLMTHTGDVMYKTGNISEENCIEFFSKFFFNLEEYLSGILDSPPVKASFTNHFSTTLVYPFRIYILVLEFGRSVLSPDILKNIEKIISLHQV
jgi:two-component system, response regulator, stage 0 sporulation protein F